MTIQTTNFLAISAAFLGSIAARAATIDLNPSDDLYIQGNGVKVEDATLRIGRLTGSIPPDGSDWRSMLIFDLSAIPSGSIINSATLTLNQIEQSGTRDDFGNAQLLSINSAWTTGDLGSTLYGYVGAGSREPGAGSSITNFSLSPNPAPGEYDLDVQSIVQDWVDGTSNNYGFGLKQTSETFTNTARVWDSSDAASNQPVLAIDYTIIPEPSSFGLLGFGLVAICLRRRR